ncbi:hypothetical protein SAY87_003983 [Trapa incisa]|uniref:Uncharacterized protein n=1 Tax=Trapa incisa TaxID=236973 RepID=A0AAN7JN31_9MYRT|nr:hypothetical protein SAY87_003983 [Trapa incisa]
MGKAMENSLPAAILCYLDPIHEHRARLEQPRGVWTQDDPGITVIPISVGLWSVNAVLYMDLWDSPYSFLFFSFCPFLLSGRLDAGNCKNQTGMEKWRDGSM